MTGADIVLCEAWAMQSTSTHRFPTGTPQKLRLTLQSLALCLVLSVASHSEPLLRCAPYTPPKAPANAANPRLVIDVKESSGQPAHFRTSRQIGEEYKGNTRGLSTLRCSGSAIFSVDQLNRMNQEIEGDILVVDLRQESHGYLNGLPITWEADNDWVNVGKTPKQCAEAEEAQLDALRHQLNVKVEAAQDREGGGAIPALNAAPPTPPRQVSVRNVRTEKEVVEDLGLGYRRLYVTDHLRPDDASVEAFVHIVDKLPDNLWLHFHCRGGKGRTTTFMAMYDMLRNSNKVSLEDILARQAFLDPKYNLAETKPDSARTLYYQERYQFLQAFYQYTQERGKSGVRVPWSLWCKVQPKS